MAVGWKSLLKVVPWRDVMEHAPVVADGAKKLWQSVSGRPEPASADAAAEAPAALQPSPDPAVAALAARLAGAEAQLAELQREMLASAALLKDVAEQNAGLVERAERLRKRTLWLTVVAVAALLAALASVAFALGY